MSETLLRQWALLREIPRAPRRISAADLHRRLSEAGHVISKRSIERDLQMLSALFPLTHDDRSIPYGWSWLAESPSFDLPAMDGETALTLTLVEREIAGQLPPAVIARLQPYFSRASRVLQQSASASLRRWSESVRVIPKGMRLLPPPIDPARLQVVYEALFEGRKLKVRYRSRSSDAAAPQSTVVTPLALVAQGELLYLVVIFDGFDDPRPLALHRIDEAEKLDQPAAAAETFSLDDYLAKSPFQLPTGRKIRLEARFDSFTARHLTEMPLSADQTSSIDADGRVRVSATVELSEQLIWWLLGFGANVEVVGPDDLRNQMASELSTAHRQYE